MADERLQFSSQTLTYFIFFINSEDPRPAPSSLFVIRLGLSHTLAGPAYHPVLATVMFQIIT